MKPGVTHKTKPENRHFLTRKYNEAQNCIILPLKAFLILTQYIEAVLLSVKTNRRSYAGQLSLPNMVVKDVPDHDLLQIINERWKDKHFTVFFDRVQFSLFALIIVVL